jgi:signal transduction histidine kinase
MGILILEDVHDEETGEPLGDHYEVTPAALPLFGELASDQDTPFSVLISALLSDETSATLAPARPLTARQAVGGAAVATTRHARMVAHEINNALVPVQGALEALYRDAERRGSESLVEGHREAIDHGIERVFSFIKDMMEVAERGAEPPDAFGFPASLRGAVAAPTSELGGDVTFEPVRVLPPVTGHRNRFTLAVVNLLRNALQTSAAGPVKVRVSAEVGDLGADVLVLVEDSGPGVPAEHRSAIFKQGFSLRPGGTGQGLALVREVVESEMGGRATCEDSPLGGARFVLRVPVTERTAG